MFYICFPREGNFDIGAGDGGGGAFKTKTTYKSQQIQQNSPYENCSRFWDIFQTMFKNIFIISSYIQKNDTESDKRIKDKNV